MTALSVDPADLPDLQQCAAEPIHIPGSVQPHGVLLALADTDLRIVQSSESSQRWLGISWQLLVGQRVVDALGEPLDAAIRAAIARYDALPSVAATFEWRSSAADVALAGYLHRSGPVLVVELEPHVSTTRASSDLMVEASRAVRAVRMESDTTAKMQAAAEWLRDCSGYDRVMIYRFHEDWHGEVVAEARCDDLESYEGLHYPASDIPAQARQLYLASPTRVIVDVHYVPSPVMPVVNPLTGGPIDLSRSALRSVSPVHLEYLRNMGVRATMVASLLVEGRLWGLISCHHRAPHPVSAATRQLTDWLAHDLATQIEAIEAIRSRQHTDRLTRSRENIVLAMRQGRRLSSLLQGPELEYLLTAVAADGAAVIYGDEIVAGGVTPSIEDIREICRRLADVEHDGDFTLFTTDCLSRVLPGTENVAATASGFGMFPFDAAQSVKLVWFRGEQWRAVKWGGNPDKAVSRSPDGRLSPRQSFESWTEAVRLHSRPWRVEELGAARELGAMIDLEMRRIAEDRAHATATLLADAMDSMSAHIAVLDADGVIVTVNAAWRQFAEENHGGAACLPGANYLAVCHRALRTEDSLETQRVLMAVEHALSGEHGEFVMEYPCDSSTEARWFVMRVFPLSGPRPGAVVAHEDITVAKLAELQLRESEARFRVLFESHSAMMMLISPTDGHIVDANAAAAAFYGYDRERLRQLNLSDLNQQPIPVVLERLAKVRERQRNTFVLTHYLANGSTREVEVNISPVNVLGEPQLFSILQDVTEREHSRVTLSAKQAELEELNRSLEQRVAASIGEVRAKDQLLISQGRQAAMGEMIGNIAHQWRQPLNALGLLLSNMKDAHAHGELDAEAMAKSVGGGHALVNRMSTTINDFRNFFRPDKEHVDFSARIQVEQTMALMDASVRAIGMEIHLHVIDDITLHGLPNEYSQVLLNLLANAKDAVQERGVAHGRIDVEISARGNEGIVTVRDNGGGIPLAITERIFDPFFSTKDAGTGTGLYMSKMIIERSMNGRIEARNVADGAEFAVICPLAVPSI